MKFKGRTAIIDLSKGVVKTLHADKGLLERFVGGRGYSSLSLYSATSRADPVSPNSPLIVATGPLTGVPFPTASRSIFSAKSPLTLGLGYSCVGGFFGARMRFSGFDFLVVMGSSREPVYLSLKEGEVLLEDAKHLWGLKTIETEDALKEEVDSSVACIGPAGENLVRFACVICDRGRAAGRTGMGAVMGSKKLKAIVASGSPGVEVADPEKLVELSKEAFRRAAESEKVSMLGKYGSSCIVEPKDVLGDLPTRNHTSGCFERADELYTEVMHESLSIRPRSCFSCPIHCGRQVTMDLNGSLAVFEGMEYETIASLGSLCGNSDIKSIARMNYLCNEYGLDTISTGSAIAWTMECFERGLISREDLGTSVRWGDAGAMMQLIDTIAERKGFGDTLAEGVRRASQMIGRGTEEYAMHVKGLEMPMQEPRAVKMFGLGHATSNRGADHLYALPTICYPWNASEARMYLELSEDELGELTNLSSWRLKARAVVFSENFCALVDSLGVCKYSTVETYLFGPEDLAEVYAAVVGSEMGWRDLLEVGERTVNLERMFNIREGFGREDDRLPSRFTREPVPCGPAEGSVVEIDRMLEEYYALRGWDPNTTTPREGTLSRLGLIDIV